MKPDLGASCGGGAKLTAGAGGGPAEAGSDVERGDEPTAPADVVIEVSDDEAGGVVAREGDGGREPLVCMCVCVSLTRVISGTWANEGLPTSVLVSSGRSFVAQEAAMASGPARARAAARARKARRGQSVKVPRNGARRGSSQGARTRARPL